MDVAEGSDAWGGVPGGPVLPALGALGSAALLLFVSKGEWLFSGGSLVVGALLYVWVKRAPKNPKKA